MNSDTSIGYGLGTANSKRGNKTELDEKIINDTLAAIRSGYYHLDCAESYGNESELGTAISRSGLPRSKFFITTKTSCRPGETIETAFSRSLQKLNLDYIDLYLIHSPFFTPFSPQILQQKWSEMEAILASGRARSIGVSNFLIPHLETILQTAKVAPAVNQIEYHPYLQHKVGGEDLVGYCREKGIALEAYSPLAAVTRAQGGPVDGVYERVAKKYGVTEGEVALRWCLDQGVVVLTTSKSEQRLQEWMNRLPRFKLTPREIEEISEKGMEKHVRLWWTKEFDEGDRR
ncbi:hypothetical protein N0V88_000405 [Collariella sp. IMI 366227]|nr:hypothetical protein N0V88_000405 [Collariella sp. IMI 366227]